MHEGGGVHDDDETNAGKSPATEGTIAVAATAQAIPNESGGGSSSSSSIISSSGSSSNSNSVSSSARDLATMRLFLTI